MEKPTRKVFLTSFKLGHNTQTWLGFLSIGILLISIGMGALSFFGRTNDASLKFPVWSADNTKRSDAKVITMRSSITDDLGNRLGDTIAEKISSAGSLEEVQAQFKNPEELKTFVEHYLDQNMSDYEQMLQKDIARSIKINVQINKKATQKEKENYLRTVRALVDPSRFPETQAASSLGAGETFYINLAKKLENLKVPSEYYVIHHELIRAVKTKAIGYNAIAGLDTDPLKSALVMKMMANVNDKLAAIHRALLSVTS